MKLNLRSVNFEMSFCCLQFPPKNERKKVNLRLHSSKVEFVHSFFGGNVGLKKSFRLCLTFSAYSHFGPSNSHFLTSQVMYANVQFQYIEYF